jgi:arylformamidase
VRSAVTRAASLGICGLILACGSHTLTTAPSPCDHPPDHVIRLHDLRYGAAPLEFLDLFLPEARAGEPLVVMIHGGGWNGGDKAPYGIVARHLSTCGIAVANIDYPLGVATHSMTQAASTLAALRWLEGKAAVYGYAPDRTSLLGHSAGAQIAALAVLDPALAQDRRGAPVSGVIAISGLGYSPPQPGEVAALAPYLARFYRAAFGPDARSWQRYDLTRYVHAGPPAFLIIHARDDTVAPEDDSSAFVVALRRAGTSVDYLQPSERDHNSVLADVPLVPDDETGRAIESFVFSR